jgi:transglutaminase-like putative cysteine protease
MHSHRKTITAALATVLASVSLYPVFIGIGWFWVGTGAVIMVAIAGTLTRLRRLPVVVALGGTLIGLLLYLNLGFESARSLLHVLPTPSSLSHLWGLAGQGISESAKYAPPVPELRGMMLLAVAGIGLTAVLTDLIAVRLGSAALAGLPLLLLFTEPFTLSVSRSGMGTTIAFCLGTIGYLTMLSTEGRERIRAWERIPTGLATEPDTRALAAAGRRAGLASVVLALCVPLFVPGLHTTRLFGGGTPGIGGVGGSGHGVGFPDPQTQLSQDLHESHSEPVLDYWSSDGLPEYLQVYVLDDLTDSGWHLSTESLAPATPKLPSPPGLSPTNEETWTTSVTTRITIDKSVSQDSMLALPAPYPAVQVQVSAPGEVQVDRSSLMIFDSAALGGLSYSVTNLELDPAAQTLAQVPKPPRDIAGPYLAVPPSYDSLRSLANDVVVGAKTPFAKAVALQEWLGGGGGGFSYTLNAPTVTNASQLKYFLENSKSGYCQQFSFAMAVLARLVGIPSRVAYGYTSGTAAGNNTWRVTTHDAHAWPELYFQGFGWLRFEPTPTGRDAQGTATTPSYTEQPASAYQQQQKTSSTSPGTSPTSTDRHAGFNPVPPNEQRGLEFGGTGGATASAAHRAGPNPWELAGLSLLGLLVLAAIAPGCARLVIRRYRWRAGAHGGDAELAHTAWRELRDDLMDYRGGYAPSESPRALASRVSADLRFPEPAAVALRRITMAEERARYSARPTDGGTLPRDAAVVRRTIAAAVSRRTRWRARLFPSSVLTPVGIGVSQVTDLFGRVGPDWRLGKGGQAKQVGSVGA